METDATSALKAACEAVKGTSRLAVLLSERLASRNSDRTVSKASVSRWKREGVPAELCPDIEALTGIRCEQLRPDVNWAVLRRKQPKARAE